MTCSAFSSGFSARTVCAETEIVATTVKAAILRTLLRVASFIIVHVKSKRASMWMISSKPFDKEKRTTKRIVWLGNP
jgi:phenylpyruvate tautomerase PptA (4-oxalocrotonate tautomerase family)